MELRQPTPALKIIEPYYTRIEEFTLIFALWVIRVRWQEIPRFVLEFKVS